MKRPAPQWYPSPIDLPEGRSGKVQVTHRLLPIGASVSIIGLRQALLRGIAPVSGKVEKALRVHELREDGQGVWMTDLPEELNQIAELMLQLRPRGRVLVGGLGLGVLATTVAQWPGVEDVVVVENNPDVIKLCRRPGYHVVEADLRDYLTLTHDRVPAFDFYLLDTWQETNEGAWWSQVMPLRRIIRNRWGQLPRIHCWAEDIMQAQLAQSLMTKEPHWYYKHLPVPMSAARARAFLREVGLPRWERTYGAAIDRTMAEMAEERQALV